jgi:predicted TPR repeat methyltransferase
MTSLVRRAFGKNNAARRAMLGQHVKKRRQTNKQWWSKFCKAFFFAVCVIIVGVYKFGGEENQTSGDFNVNHADLSQKERAKLRVLEDKAQIELLTGKYESADKLYAKILEINPKHSESLYVRGIIRTTRTDETNLREGIEFFKQALHVEPRRSDYYAGLAEAYQALGEITKALSTYERVVKYAPKDVNAHNDIGLLYMDQQKMKKARFYLEKAVKLKPDHPEVLNNLGKLEQETDHIREAIEYFSKAINAKQDYAIAHLNLGTLYAKLNEKEKAKFHLKEALKIDPNNNEIMQGKFILQMLESNEEMVDPEKFEEVKDSFHKHTETLFDDYAHTFENHLEKDLKYRIPNVIREKVNELHEGERNLRILDLGCGTGLVGKALETFVSDEDGKMFGTDLSAKMILQAEKKNIYDKLWAEDCQLTLERFSDDPLDIITAADVFVYIGNLESIFSKAKESLVFGGSFIFSTETCEECKAYAINTKTMRVRHSKDYILSLANIHGFDILSSESTWGREEGEKRVSMEVYVMSPNPLKSGM